MCCIAIFFIMHSQSTVNICWKFTDIASAHQRRQEGANRLLGLTLLSPNLDLLTHSTDVLSHLVLPSRLPLSVKIKRQVKNIATRKIGARACGTHWRATAFKKVKKLKLEGRGRAEPKSSANTPAKLCGQSVSVPCTYSIHQRVHRCYQGEWLM